MNISYEASRDEDVIQPNKSSAGSSTDAGIVRHLAHGSNTFLEENHCVPIKQKMETKLRRKEANVEDVAEVDSGKGPHRSS